MRKSILVFGDIIAFYGALVLTLIIRYGSNYTEQIEFHLLPFSIIFLIWILIFYISNLYELSLVKNNLQFFTSYFTVTGVNIAISIAFFYLMPFVAIAPRRNLFILLIISIGLDIIWRFIYSKLLVRSGYKNNTLIVGLSEQSQEVYDYLLSNPQLGYNALGIIDIKDQTAQGLLEKIITQKGVKTIVIERDVYNIPHIVEILYGLVGQKMKFYDISTFSERITGKIPLSAIDQAWFLSNISESEKDFYELIKRFLDIIFSALLGLVTFPFFPFIILAVRLDSAGPVFYTQTRVGRGGKKLKLIKFRSMRADSEAMSGPQWATESDERSTGVGKFLRKSRIDELPQLWNILKGEMSFVGPRPERPEFYEKLKKEIPFYEERNLATPGLTGWAQIKYMLDFRTGMTIKHTLEKVQYDLYYVKNRSLLLDFGIILKTINILLLKLFAPYQVPPIR